MRFLPPLMILAAAMIAVVVAVVVALNMESTTLPQQPAVPPTSTQVLPRPTVTPHSTPTPVPTLTESPGSTQALVSTPTATPLPTTTSTPEPTPTATPLPTATPTPRPTNTPAPTPTRVPPTPVPTFEELRAKAQDSIPYDDLHRYIEEYIGDLVYYKAEVDLLEPAQSWEEWSERSQSWETHTPEYDYLLYVSITPTQHGWYEDQIYLRYSGPRLLREDLIEFVGQVEGLSNIYGSQGPPELSVKVLRLVAKAGDR